MTKILEKQAWHLLILAALLAAVSTLSQSTAMQAGALWGQRANFWLWLAVLIPVVHQIYVVIAWRGQLHHKLLTRLFGDKAFMIWKVSFLIFLLARPMALVLLAVANANQMALAWPWRIALTVILFPIFAYSMYSIMTYFGIERAVGADHFDPAAYREKTFVKEGIFKYTSNGMYKFGFVGLWLPGIIAASPAALLAAAFSHAYIWVHFYTTEQPDMKYIYEERS